MDIDKRRKMNDLEVRFMRPDEAGRLAELIGALQAYQQLKGVGRIPSGDEIAEELTHQTTEAVRVGNNLGSFVAIAVDRTKLDDKYHKSYIVGYIIYSQNYSIINGRQFYMTSLFIEKDYRFFGLGRLLIDFMRVHGESLGNNRFDVPFMNNNSIGIRFYQKMGAYYVTDEYNLSYFNLNPLKRQ